MQARSGSWRWEWLKDPTSDPIGQGDSSPGGPVTVDAGRLPAGSSRPSMPHLHEKIDFTVALLIVDQGRVLVILHRKLGKWLPIGGHIELDEDPEQAALREAREETGLEVRLLGERPPTTGPGTRALIAPRFLDIHRISDTHEHIGMIYLAQPVGGTLALAAEEHLDIRWCTPEQLDLLEPPMSHAVRWYCLQAIDEVSRMPQEQDNTRSR